MIKGIRHTGLVVSNLNKSIYFFKKILGFKIFKHMDENGEFVETILNLKNVKLTTVKLKSKNGQMIELLRFHNIRKDKSKIKIFSQGLTHISFDVDNINKTYNLLKKNNCKFLSKPKVNDDKTAKVVFCKGPDNFFLELVQILK